MGGREAPPVTPEPPVVCESRFTRPLPRCPSDFARCTVSISQVGGLRRGASWDGPVSGRPPQQWGEWRQDGEEAMGEATERGSVPREPGLPRGRRGTARPRRAISQEGYRTPWPGPWAGMMLVLLCVWAGPGHDCAHPLLQGMAVKVWVK